MKNALKFTGILLVMLLAVNGTLNAQRGGMRGMMMDTARMGRQGRGMMRPSGSMRNMPQDSMRMNMMRHGMDSMRHGQMNMAGQRGFRQGPGMGPGWGMRGGMGYGAWNGMGHGRMNPGMRFGMTATRPGMGRGFGAPGMYGMRGPDRWNMGRFGMMREGRPMIENIPNLTDKQKKDLADLRTKQREEITKFREETAAKMKAIRETNKTKMMNMLSDEQKKFLDTEYGIKPVSPVIKK
jgi:hypothetical protein